MTSRYVQPDDIYKRYETHHKKIMTLYVTRQEQQFVVSSDITLCDLELIRSSVELVGEPGVSGGFADIGTDGNQVGRTIPASNIYYGETYNAQTLNQNQANAIQNKTTLNHSWVNVEIKGMSEARNFMRDDRQEDNELSIVIPTDNGWGGAARGVNANGPINPIKLENIKLNQNITIACQFAGSASKSVRTARFAEDFADTDVATYRSADGTVKYYNDTSGHADDTLCQIPANVVNSMILQFQMTPRSQV